MSKLISLLDQSLILHAQCLLQWFLVLSPLPLLKPITPSTTSENVTFPAFILIVKYLQVLQWNRSYHALYAMSFLTFAASYYYHTYPALVIGTLSAAPVDNIYKISIISFLTVLPQGLHANLFLALVYTFCF